MLTCGHCFCNECIAIIIEQYSVGTRRSSIKCAICRQTTSHKEISYVFTAETANQEDDIPVKVDSMHIIDDFIRKKSHFIYLEVGFVELVVSTTFLSKYMLSRESSLLFQMASHFIG